MQDLLLVLENDYKILGKLVILTKSFQNPEETQDILSQIYERILTCLNTLIVVDRPENASEFIFRRSFVH